MANQDLDAFDLPERLTALLGSRLDSLAALQREAVRAMSVFGDAFTRHAFEVLTDLDGDSTDQVLAELVATQVLGVRADPLSPETGQYTFTHVLLRMVAYRTLPRRERRRRHAQCADYLERFFPDQGERVVETIAAHRLDAFRAARAGEPDHEPLRVRALAALRRAADRAETLFAHDSQRHHLLAAAEVAGGAEHGGLIAAAARAALRHGRSSDALELADTAAAELACAGREREAALAVGTAARALAQLGRLPEAAQRLIVALDGADSAGFTPDDICDLGSALAAALIQLGELERAEPVVERACQCAASVTSPFLRFMALHHRAYLLRCQGRPEAALEAYDAAIEAAGDELLARVAFSHRAYLALLLDRPDAEELLRANVARSRRAGDRPMECGDVCNCMSFWLLTGRWDELEPAARGLLEVDERRIFAEFVHLRLAEVHAARGEWEAARADLERMNDWADSANAEAQSALVTALVMVRLAEPGPPPSVELVRSALDNAQRAGSAVSEAVRDLWPLALEVALQSGRLDDAGALVDQLAGRTETVPPYLLAHLARARGLLAAREEDADAAEEHLADAVRAFTRLAYPYWRARALTDLAEELHRQGRSGSARPLLDDAAAALAALGAAPALARVGELQAKLESGVAR